MPNKRLLLLLVQLCAAFSLDDISRLQSNILRVLRPQRPTPAVDTEVEAVSLSLQANGTWPDVNYNDRDGRSWWETGDHLRRCMVLASAYKSPYSRFSNDTAVAAAANKAFEWWLKADPQNTNWWWMQIGIPRILSKFLLLLPDTRLFELAVPLLDRTPMHVAALWTGCNRGWGARLHFLAGFLSETSPASALRTPWCTSPQPLAP